MNHILFIIHQLVLLLSLHLIVKRMDALIKIISSIDGNHLDVICQGNWFFIFFGISLFIVSLMVCLERRQKKYYSIFSCLIDQSILDFPLKSENDFPGKIRKNKFHEWLSMLIVSPHANNHKFPTPSPLQLIKWLSLWNQEKQISQVIFHEDCLSISTFINFLPPLHFSIRDVCS